MGDHPQVSGRRGLERGVPLGLLALQSNLQNKFFDLSTPAMRKGCDGEEVEEKKKKEKRK